MKTVSLILSAVALFILLASPANAGISLGKGGITLASGQTQEMCDVWIYATQDGGTYHVETTGNLQPLTAGVEPNDFTLAPIDCPQETSARRACITEKCLSSDHSSCRVVCIKFTAPLNFDWSGQKAVYEGSILNSIKIGAATLKEPYPFSVHVEPADVRPVVFGASAATIAVAAASAFFLRKRKKTAKR